MSKFQRGWENQLTMRVYWMQQFRCAHLIRREKFLQNHLVDLLGGFSFGCQIDLPASFSWRRTSIHDIDKNKGNAQSTYDKNYQEDIDYDFFIRRHNDCLCDRQSNVRITSQESEVSAQGFDIRSIASGPAGKVFVGQNSDWIVEIWTSILRSFALYEYHAVCCMHRYIDERTLRCLMYCIHHTRKNWSIIVQYPESASRSLIFHIVLFFFIF